MFCAVDFVTPAWTAWCYRHGAITLACVSTGGVVYVCLAVLRKRNAKCHKNAKINFTKAQEKIYGNAWHSVLYESA